MLNVTMVISLNTVHIFKSEEKGTEAAEGEYPEATCHFAVFTLQFHTTVSSKQCSISAVNRVEGRQWKVGPHVWRVQRLMNGALFPWEDFKQARINQPGGAPVAEPCPPAVSPKVSDALSMPSHTTDWLTHWPGVSQVDCRQRESITHTYAQNLRSSGILSKAGSLSSQLSLISSLGFQ